MPTYTPNYNFALPLVNNATDQDLWGGYINSNFSSLDTILQSVGQEAYPVGSIYTNMTNPTNPATLLGYGTWTALVGVCIVGVGTGTDSNGAQQTFTAGTQVGEYVHTLTITEMPTHNHYDAGHTHTHPGNINGSSVQGGSNVELGQTVTATSTGYANIQNTGGGGSHNNVQPVIGAYMWERTA